MMTRVSCISMFAQCENMKTGREAGKGRERRALVPLQIFRVLLPARIDCINLGQLPSKSVRILLLMNDGHIISRIVWVPSLNTPTPLLCVSPHLLFLLNSLVPLTDRCEDMKRRERERGGG